MWLIYAISAAAVWGMDYALGERILKNKISPVSLMAFQMAIGSIVFLTLGKQTSLKRDLLFIMDHPKILLLVLSAIVSFNLGNFLIFVSIQEKNATVAGLIELCYPIFTVAFTYLIFGELHLNPAVVGGSILILAGVLVIGFFGG